MMSDQERGVLLIVWYLKPKCQVWKYNCRLAEVPAAEGEGEGSQAHQEGVIGHAQVVKLKWLNQS
jgi:hypothetical protein